MTVPHEEPGLRIRWFRPTDADRLLTVTADPLVMRHVGDGHPLNADQVDLWIARSLGNYEVHGYGSFALADPGDDVLFGWGGFVPPGREPVPELIYGVEQARWGRGLGRKAAAALVRLGRERFGFTTILATIDAAHAPSRRIVEALGFHLDGIVQEDGVRVCRYLL